MPGSDDEILQIFYTESKEHLDGLEDDLLVIEKQGADSDVELVNRIFRAVHTIKGGCGFFGLDKLSALSHSMENVLDRIRKKEIIPNSSIVNALLKGADQLKAMVNEPECTDALDIEPTIANFKKILTGSLSKEEKKSVKETIDIKLPNGHVIFSINKYEFDRAKKAEKGGTQIYLIEYDLIHDIERQDKTPWNIIAELLQLSVFIDSRVDVEGVGDLGSGDIPTKIPFYALIATIIETDLIYDFLGLKESKVHLISDTGEIIESKKAAPAEAKYPEAEKLIQKVEHQAVKAPEPVAVKSEPTPEKIEEPVFQPDPVFNSKETSSPSPVKDESAKKNTEVGSVRVNVTLLDKLMTLAGELVLARNQLLQSTSSKDTEAMENSSQRIDLITAELQEAIMATRMQAISIVFHKFNRIVRDMARDLCKDVRLVLEGEEVELDKSIIESIGDPLTHLVRNALDHGIEKPEQREAAGKNKQATLKISAYHEAGHVIIKIADDGAGIRLDKVKAKALSTGLCTQDQLESMSEKEMIKLIFRPGFSTAEKVTGLSGRGVGMDVVMTNLTKLGGTVDIETEAGSGTTVVIKLPLTLAIIPSLLLSVCGERFAIPQVNLVELVRIAASDAQHKIEEVNGAMVMRLRDRLLPLVKMSDIINNHFIRDFKKPRISGKTDILADKNKVINIAVVMAGNIQYGLIVDSLLDSSEIVVKPLGQHLKKCRSYAAATILGDGRVALILDLIGISQMVGLTEEGVVDEDAEGTDESVAANELALKDRQTLLLVHNGENEPFGIPLGLVARIEKIKTSDIESHGGRKAIKYRDGILPLFALEEVANVALRPDAPTLVVVVFKVGGREVGLMLSEIIDIVETDSKVDDATYKQAGIYGSSVINNKITLLIDLYSLVYTLMPDWHQEVQKEIEVKDNETGGKPTVLIAEDSKFFMSQIKGFMEDAGYDVLTAEDGALAFKVLTENPDKVNIVLTDIEMPNLDGFGFAEKVRAEARFTALPIIAVTSIAGAAAEQRGKQVGLDEYLIKLDRDEILSKCSYYLKNGRKQ